MVFICMLSAFALMIAVVLLPVKTKIRARIRKGGVYASVCFGFVFGALPFRLSVRILYRYPFGFVLFPGMFPRIVLKPTKKRRVRRIKPPDPKRFIKPVSLYACGSAGIGGRPDISVMLAGALDLILTSLALPFFESRPECSVLPSFYKDSFALNVSGIVFVYPAKLLIEVLRSGRRNKNESSDRKHNAVVHGAR